VPVLVLVLALLALLAAATPAAAAQQDANLRVMSFNLRFASETPPNSWPERQPVLRRLLRDEKPQLLGTPNGDRIDWILTTPGVTTRRAEINTFHLDGQYPSDHLPVQAVLRLPG
jgi:endonuclease/exonuclease/phosphatase family metal-dependent hydrolase